MSGASVYGLRDVWPRLGAGVYIAPTAAVIGDVALADHVSVWFGAVIRGDEMPIIVGAGSNIQDGTVIHTNRGGPGVVIGERVTIGHGARLHGCNIDAGALIGIGAIVLDGAVVENGAMVAAGALVPPANACPPVSFGRGRRRFGGAPSARANAQCSRPPQRSMSRTPAATPKAARCAATRRQAHERRFAAPRP